MTQPVIGSAGITIEADASGFEDSLTKGVSAQAQSAGTNAGKLIVRGLQATVAAGAIAVGALVGKALDAGFARLVSLDSATAKMQGLGIVGDQLKTVMAEVSKSAEGTSYSLADMASSAALMMTSGIKPGAALDATLAGITATASAAGTSIADITSIFQKVAAEGKVTSEDLRQLSERGVNGLDAIAKHYGITGAAAQKMVTDGKVGITDFTAAMNEGMGGMATAVGSSFAGMRDNINSAFGRIGAAVLGPFFDGVKLVMPAALAQMKAFASQVTVMMAPIEPMVLPVFQHIADVLSKMNFGAGLQSMLAGISSMSGVLAPVAGIMAGSIGPLLHGLPLIGPMFEGITATAGGWLSVIALMITNSAGLRDALAVAFSALGPIVESLTPVLTGLSSVVNMLAGYMGDILGAAIQMVVPFIVELASTAGTLLTQALGLVMQFLPPIMNIIMLLIPPLMQVADALIPVLVGALAQIVGVVSQLIPPFLQLVMAIMPSLMQVVSALVPIIAEVAPLFAAILQAVIPVIAAFMAELLPTLKFLIPIIAEIVSWMANNLAGAFKVVGDIITVVTDLLKGNWSGAWAAAKQAGSDFVDFIVNGFTGLLAILSDIVGKIGAALKPAWDEIWAWLTTTWTDFWNGLTSGVSTGTSSVWTAITDWLNSIGAFFTAAWNSYVATVMGVLTYLYTILMGMLQPIFDLWNGFWGLFGGVITSAWNLIVATVQLVIAILQLVILTAWNFIVAQAQAAWSGFLLVITTVWNGLVAFLAPIVALIVLVVTAAWTWISTNTAAAWNAISGVVSSVWNTIYNAVASAISRVQGVVSSVMATVRSVWDSAWSGISGALGAIWAGIISAVSTAINNVVTTVTGLKDRVVGFFSGAGTWLLNSGKAIIQGLIDGVQGMLDRATGAVQGVMAAIKRLIPSSPALEGPFSGRGWTLYSGMAITDALSAGILASQDSAVAAARSVMAATKAALGVGVVGTVALPATISSAAITATTSTEKSPGIDISDASLHALALAIAAALWPAARAAQIVEDFEINGATLIAKGLS